MCTPTKDQVIHEVRQHLDAANLWVLEHTPHNRDVFWTGPVKTALCNACHAAWGACNSMWICATGVGHRDPKKWRFDPTKRYARDRFVSIEPVVPPSQDRAAHQGEWLYDVTCFQYEEPWPTGQRMLLVAEVEWGGRNAHAAVLEDFGKLLVARAELRVMVYNQDDVPICELAGYIRQCLDSQVGDTYLIAGFAANQIFYHRIDVIAPAQVVVQQLL